MLNNATWIKLYDEQDALYYWVSKIEDAVVKVEIFIGWKYPVFQTSASKKLTRKLISKYLFWSVFKIKPTIICSES